MADNLTALIILDGFGYGKDYPGNAILMAHTPNFYHYRNEYPNAALEASGEAAGLPEGQMGNSEVGHLNIGAGRIVYQSLTRINLAIKSGVFFQNPALLNAVNHVKAHDTKLHILGLISAGGVHSELEHVIALIKLAKEHELKRVFVHAILDGRDVPPKSALTYIGKLEEAMKEFGTGKITTVSGRYYAMDRDKNYDRTQKAYNVMTWGKGLKYDSAEEGIEASYFSDIVDEFVEPFMVDEEGMIEDNDAVIFANFRPDRAIQIATAISNPEHVAEYAKESKPALDASKGPRNVFFVSMMHYSDSVQGEIAYPLQELRNTLGPYLSHLGLKQLRIAETEKYAHVTFFFDGGVDEELPGEKRILINSPKVATYDLKPEMSAFKVADKAVEEINKGQLNAVILNFANCDMVGHTGMIPATVKAAEAVDQCLGRVVQAVLNQGGVAIITADHGNAEKMLDENNMPFTAHTTNPVPVIITKKNLILRKDGNLGDLAPTMLELMHLPKPKEMSGESLIIHLA